MKKHIGHVGIYRLMHVFKYILLLKWNSVTTQKMIFNYIKIYI